MTRRLVNVTEQAEEKKFRDEPRRTVYRHWVCDQEGCTGEMKCLGHGISNNMGSNWAHRCETCGREAWASCSYPRIAHVPT